MYKNKRTILPLLAIILLLLQMMNPIPVYADGETPPDTPATEETSPPDDSSDTTEENSEEDVSSSDDSGVSEESATEITTPLEDGEEPAAEDVTQSEEGQETETPSAEETNLPEEPAETEVAPELEEPAPEVESESEPEADLSVADVLEQAPEGTEIVVVNGEGEIESLATEEAAELVAEADPIWCPDGVAPEANAGGCSDSFTSMTDMINWLVTNDPNQAGTIWIEDGYDSASEGVAGFTLNGGSFNNLDNNALTVQGGWDGNSGSTSITGTSTFTGDNIRIINWGNDVTINNILIDGANGPGLVVTTTGDINLNNVTSQNNQNLGPIQRGRGARLNNEGGTGNVTVTNSSFTNNEDTGLRVVSNGNITLANVIADQNGWRGAALDNFFGDGTVLVSSSTFNENDAIGLVVFSSGNVNGNNLTITGNGRTGLLVETVSDVTLISITANQNDEFGLWLEAGYDGVGDGDITLNNVTANMNGLGGAVLQAEDGNINVFTSQFNGNGADAIPYWDSVYGVWYYWVEDGGVGLAAGSWGGTGQINLENVQALNNYGDGAWLTGDDVVVRYSAFHNNGQGLPYLGGDDLWADGLYIEDLGGSSAYLECVQANNNAAYGIEIITGDITLNGATATGNGWDDFYFESDTLTALDNPCGNLGSRKANPDIPWNTVPITGGESIGLNCSAYAGTILVLPNGDEIRLPCPTIGDATLNSLPDDGLPADLPDGGSYVSALTADVIKNDASLDSLPASMIVSFLLPDNMLDASLVILYWDGSEWVEVPGAYLTTDGRFEVSVNFTGIFVLVSK